VTRLGTVASDLVTLVERASNEQRRSAAVAAAEFAVVRSGLDDRRVDDALAAVRDGNTGDTPERSAVEALAASLDAVQWDLQDRAADDESAEAERWIVFGRARAASAVYYASDPSPRDAALEALYEACAVVDDIGELRVVVEPILGR
jgi:hypothetical protein